MIRRCPTGSSILAVGGGRRGRRGDTHVKVVSSMFQDELGGVWFVLAIVHVHLEFVRLNKQRQTVKSGEKNQLFLK